MSTPASKTIPEQLADALAQVKSLETQITDLAGKVTAGETALAGAKAEHAKEKAALEKGLADAIAAAKADADAKDAEITKLKADAKTASERATEIAAGAGVPPVASDKGAQAPAAGSMSAEKAVSEFNRLTAEGKNREAGRFYAEHRKLILGVA